MTMTAYKGLFSLKEEHGKAYVSRSALKSMWALRTPGTSGENYFLPDLFYVSVPFMTFLGIAVLDLWIVLGTKMPQTKSHGCQHIYQENKELLNHF